MDRTIRVDFRWPKGPDAIQNTLRRPFPVCGTSLGSERVEEIRPLPPRHLRFFPSFLFCFFWSMAFITQRTILNMSLLNAGDLDNQKSLIHLLLHSSPNLCYMGVDNQSAFIFIDRWRYFDLFEDSRRYFRPYQPVPIYNYPYTTIHIRIHLYVKSITTNTDPHPTTHHQTMKFDDDDDFGRRRSRSKQNQWPWRHGYSNRNELR